MPDSAIQAGLLPKSETSKTTVSGMAKYLADNTGIEKTPGEIDEILNEDEKTRLY